MPSAATVGTVPWMDGKSRGQFLPALDFPIPYLTSSSRRVLAETTTSDYCMPYRQGHQAQDRRVVRVPRFRLRPILANRLSCWLMAPLRTPALASFKPAA